MHGLNKNIAILKKQDGFNLIELVVVMAVFSVVMAIAVNTFTIIARQSTQQVKISETQIEDVVGLELLRTDIEHAGYGLPLSYSQTLTGYSEAATPATAVTYNDTATTAPRPILSGDNLGAFVINSSDYLVIKSTVAGMNDPSQRWSYIDSAGAARAWGTDDLIAADRVVIIRPQASETAQKQLVTNAGVFFTQYSTVAAFPVQADDIIYGVDANTNLRAPFNRTDYYVNTPAAMPQSCAPNTGILYKATLNHGDGAFTAYPLLDCVADMQIIYRLDMDENGAIGTNSNADGSSVGSSEGATTATVQATFLSADLIRTRLKEVRVYILTHEGQMDTAFTYPNATITITDPDFGTVKTFNLGVIIGGNWQNYRWKVITLVVRPKNLS